MRHSHETFQHLLNRYIKYYFYGIIVLLIVFIFTYSPFVLGLIIGTLGSLINTFTFEYYLEKAKRKTIYIYQRATFGYLIVILSCCIWYFYKDQINIIGVVIGLMISYVLIVFKPFIHKK
ncbi:ATP synthase subunit I [Staphylococcus xylosus]|uniref:ATP synthase subunit I n=1 Tax=Staphylococcus xylosus TaxID=1288 RepID=A0A939NGC8_STAXY|nr:ATP synthase subunit I [Staphylococcus xylosus]